MALFFSSILVIGLVILGMAIGVLAGRPPIKGSCGGMGALGVDSACVICGGNPQHCDEQTRKGTADGNAPRLYYSPVEK
jgi:uncharacterized protein